MTKSNNVGADSSVTAKGVSLQTLTSGIEVSVCVVHDGVFHADDVFFAATLMLVNPNIRVVRTRYPDVIAAGNVVGDVGGVYDPATNRYDHHQKGGAGKRTNGTPYASFGLLWQNAGWTHDLIGNILQGGSNYSEVARLVDARLVEAVDAADCGYVAIAGEHRSDEPRYSISAAISSFNPSWNEVGQDFDAAFFRAVEFAQQVLRREIIRASGEVDARAVVRKAIAAQTDEPKILALDKFCPWQETVIDEAPKCLFVVFPSEDGQWRVQTVPQIPGSFSARRSLPESWAGLRGAEFAAAVRASGGHLADEEAVFCHGGLFIAGATTFEAAMQMARAAL